MEKWKKVKLSDVVELKHGHQFRSEDIIKDKGIPLIKIKQIGENGNLDLSELSYISDSRLNEFKDYIIKNGDILISLTGNVGRVVVVKNLKEIALQNYRVGKLVVNKNVSDSFIKYVIESDFVKRQLDKNSNQTAQANFGKQDLNKIFIKLPSIGKQKEIANIFGIIESIINKLDEQINECKQFENGVLNKIINNTKYRKSTELKNVCVVIDGDRGKNYPSKNELLDNGYCVFLSAKNVTNQGFKFEENKFISEDKDKKMRNGKLKRGDIIVTTRGTVGNIAIYSEEIKFENLRINSGMLIVRATKINPKYLYFSMQTNEFKKQIKEITCGNAQPQITLASCNKLKIDIIEGELQNKLLSFLEANHKKIEILYQKQIEYIRLKKALMSQIFAKEK